MKLIVWEKLRKLRALLKETAPPPEQMALRLKTVERDVILPIKAVFLAVLCYSFYFSPWFEDITLPRSVAHQVVQRFFIAYLVLNVGVAVVLLQSHRLTGRVVPRVIFVASFVDGLFVAALAFVTGGFGSLVYWMFLGLIVRNALSSPLAVPQLILNTSVCLCYLAAGVLDVVIHDEMLDFDETLASYTGRATEPFLLRLIVLWLMAACCYGVQVLFEKQRRAAEEAQEFAARQAELHSAGRLAAKIAHQLKNPLGIINNAAYTLQKALLDAKPVNPKQVEIIREEVERSDRIITRLMGYAQLAEGKVERLRIAEQLDQAMAEVFPPAAKYDVRIERDYAEDLPNLLMQRGHLSDILVNVLQNAREATNGKGQLTVRTRLGPENAILVTISDNGPGIPPEHQQKIFTPYFSTKEKGTGLGLAIVKNNLEMYGGNVRVESELGKGATFTLHFPTRTFMKMRS